MGCANVRGGACVCRYVPSAGELRKVWSVHAHLKCAHGLMVKVSAEVGRRAVRRGVERGERMQQRLSSGVDRGQGAEAVVHECCGSLKV